MSYIGNQLSQMSSTLVSFGATEGQMNVWSYTNNVDSISTVLGTNYFSDGQDRGMIVGDPIYFNDGIATTLLQVTALQASPGKGVTVGILSSQGSTGNAAQYSTAALQSALIPVANVAGADDVNFENTGTTPANLQFPTAAALLGAIPNAQVGFAYKLHIRNSSGAANTATLTTNTGITLTGTMTIAQNVTRDFVVTFTAVGATPAATVNSMGVSAAAL